MQTPTTRPKDEATRYARILGLTVGYAERAIEAEIAAAEDEQATAEIVARLARQEAA